jgi:ferredoxin
MQDSSTLAFLTWVKCNGAESGYVEKTMEKNRDMSPPGTENGRAGRFGAFGLVLPVLSLLLLAAHFLRFGNIGLSLFFAGLAALTATRRGWVRTALVGVLVLGLAVWAGAWADFLRVRWEAGQPWGRLSLIMAAVAGLEVGAVLWLCGPGGRRFFSRQPKAAFPAGLIFLLTTVALGLVREKLRFPILLADRFLPGSGWVEILLLGIYGAWIGEKMLNGGRTPVIRGRIWGLFSLVFFLQLLLGLAGVRQMLMTGELHLPVPAVILAGPIYRGGGFFMLTLFAVTLLLVGPAWCSHLCYIGAWDDVLSRRQRKTVRPLPSWARPARWAILASVIVAALLLRLLDASAGTAAALGGGFGLLGIGIMVWTSRKFGVMAHCTAYCPLALVADLLGRISPWRIRIQADCTRCGSCSRFCRYGALNESDFERGRPGLTCTLCGDCLSGCRQASIAYRFPGLSAEAARRAFLVLAIGLHVVFLGVARM